MKAIRYSNYGGPDVLELQDVEQPAVNDNGVLIRVRAASVNPADFHLMRGTPYLVRAAAGLTRPKEGVLGADLAGHVEMVGRNVTRLKPGDEVFGSVFGGNEGAFAECVAVREDAPVVAKPANLTFEQAAAVPLAAVTALQAVRDKAHVQPGQRVMVNGAAGGVGTFAVQLAKAFGAEVTGVCSGRNLDMVRSIGADQVVDYTQEDFIRTGQRYDVLIDIVGTRTLSQYRRILTRRGVLVPVGEVETGLWVRPLTGIVRRLLYTSVVSQRITPFFLARANAADLATLRDLLEAGTVTPVIDRTYPLSALPDAIRYLEAGHVRGKVVITV